MLITEMIKQLEKLKEQHGDIPVYADCEVDEVELRKYGFLGAEYIYVRGVKSKPDDIR